MVRNDLQTLFLQINSDMIKLLYQLELVVSAGISFNGFLEVFDRKIAFFSARAPSQT